MIKLQYFNGTQWTDCGEFYQEHIAWVSLGGDDLNYRTIDALGNVLTDKSMRKQYPITPSESYSSPEPTIIDTAIDYGISSFDGSSDSSNSDSSSDSSSFDGFGGGDFGGGGASDDY